MNGPMIHSVSDLMIMHSLLRKKKSTVDFPRNFVPKKVPPKSGGLESFHPNSKCQGATNFWINQKNRHCSQSLQLWPWLLVITGYFYGITNNL